MTQIHPVSFDRHGKKQLLPQPSWKFTEKQHLAPLLLAEFVQASHCFPIIFLENKEEVAPYALLGLQPGKNLFVDENKQWQGNYIPAIFRRYPFTMAQLGEDKNEYALCVDEDSGLLVDDGGNQLFDQEGNKSEILEKALKFTVEFQKQTSIVKVFCSLLQKLDLLSPLEINLKGKEKTVKLEGLLRIDEKKFNNLNDEDFIDLRKKGFIVLIYAHLLSLAKLSTFGQKINPVPAKAKSSPDAVIPESFKF